MGFTSVHARGIMGLQRKPGTKRRHRAMPAVATRRVAIEFPEPLLAKTEEAASELATNRSNFIRSAVKEYIESIQRRRLERELAEAYVANAELDREICSDFDHVDAEVL
jgi:metal-responsive CopG/Arc/MetJ family transcriptional regulator